MSIWPFHITCKSKRISISRVAKYHPLSLFYFPLLVTLCQCQIYYVLVMLASFAWEISRKFPWFHYHYLNFFVGTTIRKKNLCCTKHATMHTSCHFFLRFVNHYIIFNINYIHYLKLENSKYKANPKKLLQLRTQGGARNWQFILCDVNIYVISFLFTIN